MPFLDRTTEFINIVQNKKLTIEPKRRQPSPLVKSSFHGDASKVSHGLAETSQLLQNLIKLIKKKIPFEDSTPAIHKLSTMIKNRLVDHNRELGSLDSIIKEHPTNQQQDKHSGTVVNTLFSRLYYAKDTFEGVLKERSNNMQKQREREKNFIIPERPSPIQSRLNPESQSLMLQERNFDDIASRTEAIRDIEGHVHEISGMFQKLGDLVAQQGELTQRISSNVNEALVNVEGGQEQIMQWYQKIASNRGLILKLFFILIVFIIFIAIFLL